MTDRISLFPKMMQGARAGLLATLPMTIFMQAAWMRLPARERYPLPPRQITRKLLQKVVAPRRKASERNQTLLTLLLHFLFGAMTGSLYGMFEDRIPLNRNVKGSLMGLAVWSGSYLGWIPGFGILSPATEHPWRRNLLIIVAHLVWGMVLGIFTRKMNAHQRYIDLE